jgi:hypothetical protein
VNERLGMLDSIDAVHGLEQWRVDFALRHGVYLPHFDPAEAGVDARCLLLMEAPGPMTNSNAGLPGSGFISADNDDPTAANVWTARDAAGLHDGVLHWNIVPWYLGVASRKPSKAELTAGGQAARELLSLLPRVSVVILAGEYAQRGWRDHVAPLVDDDPFPIGAPHPSGQSMTRQGARDRFTAAVMKAKRRLGA